jgi:hypothetical protein
VLNVKDTSPSGRSELDRSHESPDQELLDQVVNLLSVRDANEGRILAAYEHASMKHYRDEKARLAFGEPVHDR